MKKGWILYDEADLKLNRDFAEHLTREGAKLDLDLQTVLTTQLELGISAGGALSLKKDGREKLPDFIISRQRDELISAQFERMGVPVFNGSRVCGICSDKRRTHQFLAGMPMLETVFISHRYAVAPGESAYPLVLKPACGHGGENVELVRNEYEWRDAADQILPQDIVQQKPATDAGKDLRVYVLFGKITAAVMRTARTGIVSNFKRGGSVELHMLMDEERTLAENVIAHFDQAGAPLCFAGVDMLYEHGKPVLSEVEDVVGSRMLYKVSSMDIAELYLEQIRARV